MLNTETWAPLINICSTVCLFPPASRGNVMQPSCYKAWAGPRNNLRMGAGCAMAVLPEGRADLGRKDRHRLPSSFRDFLSQKNSNWSKSFSSLPRDDIIFFQTIKFMESEMIWLSLAPVNFIVIHGQIYLCLVLIYNLSIYCSGEIWLKRR